MQKKALVIIDIQNDITKNYDMRKIDEMLQYYESKGCNLITLDNLLAD